MTEQVQKVIYADTFFKRLKGLKQEPENTMLILPNCRAIHTFGMKKPLDIAFLDNGGNILKKVVQLKPWRIAIGPTGTQTVIEII